MQRVAMAEGGAGAGRTLGAVIREKDEELALFLQMRRRRGQEADLLLDGDAGDDDGLLLLDPPPPPPPPPHAGKKSSEISHWTRARFLCSCCGCSVSMWGAKTLAYPVWVYGAEPRAPAPAGYRMGGGFRRAPGGADDFLHSDAGDKNDYDW
jgi:hypothetical protein